ncbi:MAG: HD domain-containing protein [Anaerolineaceae bacterium]|nr:HD domain-containing protein [Anaerolineaceae bacterium]
MISDDRLSQQVQFIVVVDKLKSVIRRTYLISEDRRENTAEHSWQVALLAWLLAEYAEEHIDICRVGKMLLIHDIVEVEAGDTFIYDELNKVDQFEKEQISAENLFGLLPDDQAVEMKALWHEFEARQTPEAKFAKSIDRLIPLLHNYYTEGKSWKKYGISADMVLYVCSPIQLGSEKLWEYAQNLIEDSVQQGFLAPPRSR